MTRYRMDVQVRIPTDQFETGFYYYAPTYYFEANDPSEYALGRFMCADTTNRAHNNTTRLDAWRIIDLSTGIAVQAPSLTWPANSARPGEGAGLFNTVYVSLLVDGVQKGFKRVRAPLRESDMDGVYLTISTRDYYSSIFGSAYVGSPVLRTQSNEVVTAVSVSPWVHKWTIRHGSERAARKRLPV